MYEFIQNNWLLALAFPSAFALIMGLLAKFVNKDKLLKMTVPPAKVAAKTLSLFLKKQFGQVAADKFENGFIMTLCYVVRKTFEEFEKELISDNVRK